MAGKTSGDGGSSSSRGTGSSIQRSAATTATEKQAGDVYVCKGSVASTRRLADRLP